MLGSLFHAVIYQPLYNGLIFLIDIVPGYNIGLAVIALTIIVRLLLYPSSRKAIISQMKLQQVQPEIDEINKKFKDDKEARAKETLKLYREKKINPFAPIAPLLIQLPIIFALYYVFARSGLPVVNGSLLYSFVHQPENASTNFFHLFDITMKNWPIAILAGITQFIQANVYTRLTQSKTPKKQGDASFQADLQKSMNFQMRYILPVFITFVAHSLSSAIALYWTTTNLFSIMQELITRRPLKKRAGP
jgi:YidC/Oxa1 family membrane protein insertase